MKTPTKAQPEKEEKRPPSIQYQPESGSFDPEPPAEQEAEREHRMANAERDPRDDI